MSEILETVGPVKNPLTVISIFAGIAEIGGTVVLPFLDPSLQAIYVWFLMLFPILLVLLFFWTLNKNHKVLYAPSDFQDEDNFIKLFSAPKETEKAKKLNQEVAEVLSGTNETNNDVGRQLIAEPAGEVKSKNVIREGQAEYLLAEQLALSQMMSEHKGYFKGQLQLNSTNDKYLFDGVITNTEGPTAIGIEVKYYKTRKIPVSLKSSIQHLDRVFKDSPASKLNQFSVVLAVVTDDDVDKVEKEVLKVIGPLSQYSVPLSIRIYNFEKLQKHLLRFKQN